MTSRGGSCAASAAMLLQRPSGKSDIDKYVFGVRVYEDHFEWLLNLSPAARGELDDAGSPVYFKKLTVTPADEQAWFKAHLQWSKSNRYAELEARIYI